MAENNCCIWKRRKRKRFSNSGGTHAHEMNSHSKDYKLVVSFSCFFFFGFASLHRSQFKNEQRNNTLIRHTSNIIIIIIIMQMNFYIYCSHEPKHNIIYMITIMMIQVHETKHSFIHSSSFTRSPDCKCNCL